MTTTRTAIAGDVLPWEALEPEQRAHALSLFDMHEGAMSLHYYVVDAEGLVTGRMPAPIATR